MIKITYWSLELYVLFGFLGHNSFRQYFSLTDLETPKGISCSYSIFSFESKSICTVFFFAFISGFCFFLIVWLLFLALPYSFHIFTQIWNCHLLRPKWTAWCGHENSLKFPYILPVWINLFLSTAIFDGPDSAHLGLIERLFT